MDTLTGIAELIRFAVISAAIMAIDLAGAQLTVWGLSAMHVNSGIPGPFMILMGVSLVVNGSITLNSRKR